MNVLIGVMVGLLVVSFAVIYFVIIRFNSKVEQFENSINDCVRILGDIEKLVEDKK